MLEDKEPSTTDMRTPGIRGLIDQRSLERLNDVCSRFHVRKLALFGSVVRGEAGPDSDLDVLVEFVPGHVPGFGLIDLQDELSAIFRRQVDLRTPDDLSTYFRDAVVKEAQSIYAAR